MPKDNTYLWEIQWQRQLLLLIIICLFLPICHTSAQPEETKIYTKENPLVYEDAEDLWPYAYLNDEGQPEGFNIDLVEKLLKELNIPYVIRLKPAQEAFDDLKTGKADLTLGLAAFHHAYGHYGRHTIVLFTPSVATPKSQTVEIKTFRDLGKEGLKVIVNDSSLCHHLMLDYGWGDNAIVSRDMKKSIQQISADGEGQIVWNTLSLRWLIKHYHLNNLELTPVNMPHGEYKFMSNDQHLLDLLDEAYANLHLEDEIAPIENKWLYPEHRLTAVSSDHRRIRDIPDPSATHHKDQQATEPPPRADQRDHEGAHLDLRRERPAVLLARRERQGGLHLHPGGVLKAL